MPNEAWGWLPLLTGVAVVDALGEVTGLAADLKWPNNVLLGDGKGRHPRRSGRTPTGGRGGCGPERDDDCPWCGRANGGDPRVNLGVLVWDRLA